MLTLIVNPTAGKGRALRAAEQIAAELARRGVEHRILKTEGPGGAASLAKRAAGETGCDGVVAVGGDGTLSEVASGLAETGVPMGIIPAGTGNDLIKSLGLPKDPMACLELILTKEPRPTDILRVNERRSLNVTGLGFDVAVLEQTPKSHHLHGLLPYLIGLLRAIRTHRPVHVRFELDGGGTEERDVLLLAAANGRYIGGGIPVCPAAVVDDGRLDMVLVEDVSRWRIPLYLPGLLFGRILRFRITRHALVERLHIVSPGMKVQIDGEIVTMDEATIAVEPGGILLWR